jgi:hypothetical protein
MILENHVSTSAEQSRNDRSSTSALQGLIDARRRIEKRANWSQKPRFGVGGPLCAEMAIDRAIGSTFEAGMAAKNALIDAIGRKHDGVGMQIIAFNDSHSHAEVLAAFDRAIDAERAKGA